MPRTEGFDLVVRHLSSLRLAGRRFIRIEGTPNIRAQYQARADPGKSGKLRIRFERYLDTHLGLLALACAIICSRFVDRFGWEL